MILTTPRECFRRDLVNDKDYQEKMLTNPPISRGSNTWRDRFVLTAQDLTKDTKISYLNSLLGVSGINKLKNKK
jgi:hypothetical protein